MFTHRPNDLQLSNRILGDIGEKGDERPALAGFLDADRKFNEEGTSTGR